MNVLKKVQNIGATEIQIKVREATNMDPWGASSTLMSEIARATFRTEEYALIMKELWKAISLQNSRKWRVVYKGLTLLEYLIRCGAERVVQEARDRVYEIRTLQQFEYIDDDGKDQGVNVREKSKNLVKLIHDDRRVQEERQKARQNRGKYTGISSSGHSSGGGGFGPGSRYGGFSSQDYQANRGSSSGTRSGYDEYQPYSEAAPASSGNGSSHTGTVVSMPSNGSGAAAAAAAGDDSGRLKVRIRASNADQSDFNPRATAAAAAPAPQQANPGFADFTSFSSAPAPAQAAAPPAQASFFDDDFNPRGNATPAQPTAQPQPQQQQPSGNWAAFPAQQAAPAAPAPQQQQQQQQQQPVQQAPPAGAGFIDFTSSSPAQPAQPAQPAGVQLGQPTLSQVFAGGDAESAAPKPPKNVGKMTMNEMMAAGMTGAQIREAMAKQQAAKNNPGGSDSNGDFGDFESGTGAPAAPQGTSADPWKHVADLVTLGPSLGAGSKKQAGLGPSKSSSLTDVTARAMAMNLGAPRSVGAPVQQGFLQQPQAAPPQQQFAPPMQQPQGMYPPPQQQQQQFAPMQQPQGMYPPPMQQQPQQGYPGAYPMQGQAGYAQAQPQQQGYQARPFGM